MQEAEWKSGAGFPRSHGEPVHVGDPAKIGIRDITHPEFGDPVPIRAGEVPVFWACGVTPQTVAMHARPSLLLTHAPGHMFLTDLRTDSSLSRFCAQGADEVVRRTT